MQAPPAVDQDALSSLVGAGLRDTDRAGLLESDFGDADADADEITVVSCPLSFDSDRRWALLVLPGTSSSGAEAIIMRLRSLAANNRLDGIALGTSTLRSRIEVWDSDDDSALMVLERAHRSSLRDRELLGLELDRPAA